MGHHEISNTHPFIHVLKILKLFEWLQEEEEEEEKKHE